MNGVCLKWDNSYFLSVSLLDMKFSSMKTGKAPVKPVYPTESLTQYIRGWMNKWWINQPCDLRNVFFIALEFEGSQGRYTTGNESWQVSGTVFFKDLLENKLTTGWVCSWGCPGLLIEPLAFLWLSSLEWDSGPLNSDRPRPGSDHLLLCLVPRHLILSWVQVQWKQVILTSCGQWNTYERGESTWWVPVCYVMGWIVSPLPPKKKRMRGPNPQCVRIWYYLEIGSLQR